jgi:drug/metabolite transporter (DMT)-like permease
VPIGLDAAVGAASPVRSGAFAELSAEGGEDRLAQLVHRVLAVGYVSALAAVIITGVYPALTRLSIATTTLTPADLLLFRFGVSAVLFVPVLVLRVRAIPKAYWLAAISLSFLQGWGMAACVIFGLQFAPASHAAALGPGAIAAWITLIGFMAYGIHVHSQRLVGISVIAGGVALILFASYSGVSISTALAGDGMFLLASALGATYLVYIQRRRFDPVVAAALVCVASAMVVIPWHHAFATSAIATAPVREIVWQVVLQGVLIGCCASLALNYATVTIGSQTVGVLSALVPVIGAVCSMAFTGDAISITEWSAIAVISAGVAIASMPTRTGRITAPRSSAVSSERSPAQKITDPRCGMLRAESTIPQANITTLDKGCARPIQRRSIE